MVWLFYIYFLPLATHGYLTSFIMYKSFFIAWLFLSLSLSLLPRPHAAAVRARVRAGSGRRADAGRPLHRFRASSGRTPSSPSPSPPPCRLRHRRVFTRTAQPSDSSVQGKNGSIAGRPHHRGRASSGRTPDALAITVAVAFVRPLSTHRSATACQAPCPPHRRAPPGVQVSLWFMTPADLQPMARHDFSSYPRDEPPIV